MAVINLVQDNTAPVITFNVTRTGTGIVDLTGATVAFKIERQDTGVRTNDAHNTCTIVSPATGGQCTYTLQAGDIPVAGTYTCDLQITYGNGSIETGFDPIILNVRAKA